MAASQSLLRFAFTPHAYPPAVGGAERYTRGLAESLAGRGHDVKVIVADIDNAEAFYELGHRPTGRGNEELGGVSILRVPYTSWRYRIASRIPLPAEPTLDRALSGFSGALDDAVQRTAPDVVVTLPHLFRNVPAAFRAARSSGAGVIYAPLLHETDPNWRPVDIAHYVQNADGVIALTGVERARLIDSYGAVADRTVVISPAIAANDLGGASERPPLVVFVGRMSGSKRLDVLIDAMAIVRGEFPESQLVLAGNRDTSWQPPQNTEGTRIIEIHSEDEKQGLLASAQVFANPSLTESFGIATLEAWAQSTPVVLPATPVSREVVTDGENGRLTGADAESLAAGIVELLANPELARRMGEAGGTVVRQRYSWDARAEALEALARSVLSPNGHHA